MAAITALRSSLACETPIASPRAEPSTAIAAIINVAQRWLCLDSPARILTCYALVLLLYPRAIGHNPPFLVAHGFNPFDADGAGQRPQQVFEIHPHHGFILGVYLGRIHLVDPALGAVRSDCYPAPQQLCGLVLEIDEPRRHKDEDQDQRHHHVVVKAAALVGPENVAFDGAPDAGHTL